MAVPEHGTYARYVAGCELRCEPCFAAKRNYANHRARMIAYGEWEPLVDAAPVREHVLALQAAEIGLPTISRVAGVGESTLNRLIYGTPVINRPPTRSMRPEIAARILAVSTSTGSLAGRLRIDATGTRRRLQALIALGWTMVQLGEGIGASSTAVYRLLRADRVRADRAAAVADLYDRLWDQRPLLVTPHDKTNAAKAVKMAADHGWALPMAWDDDTIDDPNAVPGGVGTASTGIRRLPEDDELLWLVAMGETDEALAQRFSVKVKSVKKARDRAQQCLREAVAA
jgi:hypothetical protein